MSRFDKFVDAGRRVFDSAHKVTVAGLVGFTGEWSLQLPMPNEILMDTLHQYLPG